MQKVLCRRPVVVAEVEQCPEHGLVSRVDPGEDGIPGDLGVARVRLDDRRDALEQVEVLYEQPVVRVAVEVALQEALDLLGPGLQAGDPAGLTVVDDRRPLVLTQRGEQVCQVRELRSGWQSNSIK